MERTIIDVGTFEVNCAILHEGGRALVVDPGADGDRIASALARLALEPVAILLTHGHFDHIGAIPDLQRTHPGLPVFVGPADAAILHHPLNQFPPDYPGLPRGTVANVRDAHELPRALSELGWSVPAEVIDTPGHTPGGVCYRFGKTLLSGDTLFCGSIGRTDFPGGSLADLRRSLERLAELPDDTTVVPGHGCLTTIGRELAENPYLKTGAMKAAVKRLNEAADAYYNGRGELMTDFEWDALFDRLKALESETGVILPDSPTNRVSADSVAGRKEPHEFAALSLAKTKSVAEVARWSEGRPIWISWKLDGLTLVVTYDGGRLARVVTRGDGHTGTNITHLASGIRGIPATIPDNGHLVVRGEAVISYADFEAFRATSDEDYANPRNLASGSLTLKDPAELARRNLRWIPFTLVHADREIVSWGERMSELERLGFAPVEREIIERPDETSVNAAIGRWTEKVTSRQNPYPVDGLVVTYDDTAYAATGSVTGHHATRAGFAFKWQDETAATTLESIEWSCAAGSITPVAVFSPVALEGTTVRRATLCNISECERLGIGGPGSELSVIKANKIIPKVVSVTKRVGTLEVPASCPVCSAPTAIRTSDSGTRTLHCTNDGCPARALAKYERFVSKDGLDIDGLAGATIAEFVNRGWIRSFADILRLDAHRDEIARLEGFGARSADNIREAVLSARACDAVHLLVALSIPTCGVDVAKRLAADRPIRELLDAAAAGDENVFAGIEGIGPVKSASFVRWYANGANRSDVADLLSLLTVTEYRKAAGGKCAGLAFVVTGDVHHYENRDALKAYVESEGGKVVGSVSAKTSFLINNDIESASGKNKKAKSLGVPIISEDEFLARFG